MNPDPKTVQILEEIARGAPQAADEWMPVVYSELRQLAGRIFRGQGSGHTLQPTALVHEAYLRLVGGAEVDWKGRTHLMAVASRAMRQILVDHHRKRRAAKRGGDRRQLTLSVDELGSTSGVVDAVALEEVLERLRALDERQSRVVELRFFGGLTVEEIAHVLGVSKSTVELEWRHARAWLTRQLAEG